MSEIANQKSVSFITMGCAKNEVDSARMSERLVAAGYAVIDNPYESDVVIVNTCSFIQAATEESIEAVLDAAGYDNIAQGDAHLIVAGCMPARYRDDLAAELPEVSRFVPCEDEVRIASIVNEVLGLSVSQVGDSQASSVAPYVNGGVMAEDGVSTHAYVKISDGCNRFCSYCTIPYIRGRYHSFAEDDIMRETKRLVEAGIREIVLIAQDTGRWGDDFEEPSTLAQLVSHLAEAFPATWFRIMYIQPEGVTDELIEAMASHDNICSYFDIPFQHCDEGLLKRMNRKGSADAFVALAEDIRARIPDVTLRTTLIAGFPGETDEQFEQLCDFVERIDFDYVGVFPYSREEGTRAYDLDGQIDEDEKRDRAQRVRDIADAVSSMRVAARVGSRVDVLVCGAEEDGQLFGRAMCQAPEVDGVTYVSTGEVGDIVPVTITDTLLYEMEGEVLS